MPWCGFWGAAGAPYWWLLPLFGLLLVALMVFVCFRGLGCMHGRGQSCCSPSSRRARWDEESGGDDRVERKAVGPLAERGRPPEG